MEDLGASCPTPPGRDEATPDRPRLSPLAQQELDEARDAWLVLQAVAEGYRRNARHIEKMQSWLDILGILSAIWLLVVLWGINELLTPGEYRAWVNTLVNIGGTLVAIGLASLTIMTWRNEWRGKTELHRRLADTAERLASRFHDIFRAEKLEVNKLQKAKQDRQAFEKEENQTLGGMPQWAKQRGFQHVGRKHPAQNVRCHECDRSWSELRPRLHYIRRFILRKCKNCGVV